MGERLRIHGFWWFGSAHVSPLCVGQDGYSLGTVPEGAEERVGTPFRSPPWLEGGVAHERALLPFSLGGRKAFLSSLRRRRERRGLRAGIEGLGIAEVKNGNVICEAAMRKQLAKGHDRPPARCCLGPAYFFFRN